MLKINKTEKTICEIHYSKEILLKIDKVINSLNSELSDRGNFFSSLSDDDL